MTKNDNLKVVRTRPNVFISCGGCKSVINNDSTCCNCSQGQNEEVESKTNIFLKHISEYLHKIGQGKPKQLRNTTYSVEKEDEFEYSKALRNVKLKCAPNCFGIKSKGSSIISEDKIIKDNLYKVQDNELKLTKKDEQKCLHVNINFVNQVNLPGSCCCKCIKKGIKTNAQCICNLELQDDTLQTLIPAGLEGSGSQYCVVISPEGETTIFYQKHTGKGEKKKKLDKDRVIKSESEGSDEEDKESSDEDVNELGSKDGIRGDKQIESISKSLTDLEAKGYDELEETGGKDDSSLRTEGSQTGEKTSLLRKSTSDEISNLKKDSLSNVKDKEKNTDDIDEILSERVIRISKEADDTFFDSGLEKTSKESLDSKGNLKKTFDKIGSQENKDIIDDDLSGKRQEDELTDNANEKELTDNANEKELTSLEQKGDLTDEDRLAGEGGSEGEGGLAGEDRLAGEGEGGLAGEGELTGEGGSAGEGGLAGEAGLAGEGEFTGEDGLAGEGHEDEFIEENADEQRSDRLKDSHELEKTADGKLSSSIEGETTTQVIRRSTELSVGKISEIYSLAIQSIESAKKNWTKDTEYLEKEVGSYLIKSMAEIGFAKPSDSINYLGERLYKYRHNVDYKTNTDADKEDALFNKEIFGFTEQKVRTFNTLKKHRHKVEVTAEEPPKENELKDVEQPTESDGKEEETENENIIGTESSIKNVNVVSEHENENTSQPNIE